jgi:haloalkane dehalogenase
MSCQSPANRQTMLEAHAALSRSTYPKLLFVGDPGVLVSPAFAKDFTKGLTNCSVVHLVPGAHYLQEDHPQTIGAHIKQWLSDLGVSDQSTV